MTIYLKLIDGIDKVIIYLRRIGTNVFLDLILGPSQNEVGSQLAKGFGKLVCKTDLVHFCVFGSTPLNRPKYLR